MIKFFRKIRYDLMEKNKTGMYFKYAIGEIVLVVIGILIALQINNWNEGRKELKKEKQLLISLSEDFKSNLKSLEGSINEIQIIYERYSLVLEYAGNVNNGLTKEMKDSIIMTKYVSTNLVDGALTSILGSNKLEIIRNDTLKSWLTKYPSYIEDIKRNESDLIDYVKDVQRPFVRSYLTLSDLVLEESRFDQLKENISKSDYEGLLRNREYLNVVMGIRSINNSLLHKCKDLHYVANEINNIIEREIQN